MFLKATGGGSGSTAEEVCFGLLLCPGFFCPDYFFDIEIWRVCESFEEEISEAFHDVAGAHFFGEFCTATFEKVEGLGCGVSKHLAVAAQFFLATGFVEGLAVAGF